MSTIEKNRPRMRPLSEYYKYSFPNESTHKITGGKMKRILTIVIAVVVLQKTCWAVGSAGYTNQVVGTKALGMGNTFVATADDPSAIYFNPAGVSQLNAWNVSVGLAPLKAKTDYTSTSGTTATMDSGLLTVPNFYIASPLYGEHFSFGFGINSPYGLETHWADDGPLRYSATDTRLRQANFQPTVAYKMNDNVSFGAGVVYSQVEAKLKSRINETALNSFLNSALTISPDGTKQLEGTGSSWGYNLGLLLKPHPQHSFGISYKSEVRAEVEGEAKLTELSNTSAFVFGGNEYKTNAKTHVKFPQSVILGYAYKPEKWTLEVDGEWVDYGSNTETKIKYDESNPTRAAILNTDNPIQRKWSNSWNLGLGANYAFNERIQGRFGYYYYPAVVPNETFEPGNPESSRNGFTLGSTISGKALTLDLAYNLIIFNDRNVNNSVGASSASTVNGEYQTTAHIFSANLTYKFKAGQ